MIEAKEIGRFQLTVPECASPVGTRVLVGLIDLAGAAMAEVSRLALKHKRPVATMSRIRGTGRGIHFGDYVRALESDHPIYLQSPFEGSDLVAGGVWVASDILKNEACTSASTSRDAALAKLRWSAGADDLPLHVHDHSDRFIIVLDGRGYFHVSGQSPERFDGTGVRSIPARERDVFIFTRGLLHTFSTSEYPMTLLSCQMPYLAFDDPDQYRIPAKHWIARENPEASPPTVACDPLWAIGLGGC